MFTMVNAMQWAVRTVIQRANALTFVIDKDDKDIADSALRPSIVLYKLSTVMGSGVARKNFLPRQSLYIDQIEGLLLTQLIHKYF